MRGERRGALLVAGAERTRNRGSDAAAHRAARHGHGEDHAGKHQRHRRQRLDAEPADIGGLRNDDAGAGRERDDVRPGEPQQRAQDRPVEQRILRRRRRWRQRTFVLVDGYFGNADIGHFCSRASVWRPRAGVSSTANADSACAKRNGGLRDCGLARPLFPQCGRSPSDATRSTRRTAACRLAAASDARGCAVRNRPQVPRTGPPAPWCRPGDSR